MAEKISISTSQLREQADRLKGLESYIDDISTKANRALDLMDEALSAKFSLTMHLKKVALLARLRILVEQLGIGASVATKCAESFENADKVLRDEIGDSLPDDIVDSPVSNQEVKTEFQVKVDEMREKEGFKQGDYNYNDFMSWVSSYKEHSVGGAQCYAMAHMMQIEVLGDRGYDCGTTSFDDIKVGDVIHYKGGGADKNNGHWVFVTDVQPGKIVVSEANWDPPYGGKVSHGREIVKGSIEIQKIRRV